MKLTRRAFTAALAAGALARPAIVRAAAGEPLTCGYVPGNSLYWDIDVAIEKGFFREAGFEPQIGVMQSSPHSIQQALAGAFQIAGSQPETFAAAVTRGADQLRAMAAPMNRADWCLNVQKDITKITDLKGKVIGVSTLRSSEVWLTNVLLEKGGLKKGDVNYLVVGTSAQKLAAMQKGSIAGSILFQPTAELAIRTGFPAVARYGDLRAYPAILYIVDKNWAAKTDAGKRAAGALLKAHQWLYDPANKQEAVAILVKISKREPAVVETIYDQYFVSGKIYSPTGAVEVDGLAKALADMAEDGDIIKPPAPPATRFLLDHDLGGMWN
jgi:ABC-type nitrate/sulfonate/bicarbonate transport system substrate-binding protein